MVLNSVGKKMGIFITVALVVRGWRRCRRIVQDLSHYLCEFLKRNTSIFVLIHFNHDLRPQLFIFPVSMRIEYCLEFVDCDHARVVLVKECECRQQIRFRDHLRLVDCGCDELLVVHEAVTVFVQRSHHFQVLPIQHLNLIQSLFQLVNTKFPVFGSV